MAQHQGTSLLLCLGLSGIGVGLGARLPIITEQSPSRIAAGFGGTLNLVIGTLFIVLVLALATLPCHSIWPGRWSRRYPVRWRFSQLQIGRPPWLIAGSFASLIGRPPWPRSCPCGSAYAPFAARSFTKARPKLVPGAAVS